jgi:hypothetical protein
MATDVQGREFAVGQTIARPEKIGIDSVAVKICKVTRIDGDKIYLDDSKQAIKFPERLAIIN